MRILVFAAGGDIGGGKTHILNLARELSKENELRLVCFRIGEMSKEAESMGIDTAYIDVKEGWAKAVSFAFREAQEFKPDLIHCHGSKANVLGVLVKRKIGVPVITTVHSDPDLDYMGSPIRNITYGNLNRWALKHMDHYVAVGEAMHNLLIERGFEAYKIDHIYNGLDFSQADKLSAIECDNNTITIGIAARLNPVKDISTLIKAFAIAYKKDSRLRLSIAGSGEEADKLKALAQEQGIASVTSFEGWVSDMPSYFKKIDINVLSSLSETFPYSLLEGALLKVPAIASKVGGIPYLISDKETGLLFEAGDVDSFAEKILLLASDKELRIKLGNNLFQKAQSVFSLESMRSSQQAIYEKIAARKNKLHSAVLCGAYGKGNAGDDAILKAIISSLRSIESDIKITVMSRKPIETSRETHVNSVFTFNLFKLKKILRHTDLFISGGGTLIQDVTSTRSLLFYLYAIKLAKRCGAKVEMYGCGIGPISKEKNKRITSRILNSFVDVITLRDSISEELLKEIGVSKPKVLLSADPTVNLPEVKQNITDDAFAKIGIKPEDTKIIFCLRPWNKFTNYEPIVKAAEYAYNKYGLYAVFIPMEYPRDVEIGELIGNQISTPHFVSSDHYSIEELRGMLRFADVVVGMRLHSLIFAAAGGAPIVGLSYDVKVDSFIKDSGAKRLVHLEDLTPESLIENIELAIEDGRAMGEETKIRLQTLETQNKENARELLEDK